MISLFYFALCMGERGLVIAHYHWPNDTIKFSSHMRDSKYFTRNNVNTTDNYLRGESIGLILCLLAYLYPILWFVKDYY